MKTTEGQFNVKIKSGSRLNNPLNKQFPANSLLKVILNNNQLHETEVIYNEEYPDFNFDFCADLSPSDRLKIECYHLEQSVECYMGTATIQLKGIHDERLVSHVYLEDEKNYGIRVNGAIKVSVTTSKH